MLLEVGGPGEELRCYFNLDITLSSAGGELRSLGFGFSFVLELKVTGDGVRVWSTVDEFFVSGTRKDVLVRSTAIAAFGFGFTLAVLWVLWSAGSLFFNDVSAPTQLRAVKRIGDLLNRVRVHALERVGGRDEYANVNTFDSRRELLRRRHATTVRSISWELHERHGDPGRRGTYYK